MARAWCPDCRQLFGTEGADQVDDQRSHHCSRNEAGSFQMAAFSGGGALSGSFVCAVIVGNCRRRKLRAERTQAVAGVARRCGAEPAYGWPNVDSMNTSRWLL